MVLVGFGSYRGTVIAAPRWGAPAEVMVVPPARVGSLEHRLHESAARAGRAGVRPAGRGALTAERPDWLTEPVDHRAVGVVYDPSFEEWGNYVPTRLPDRYDAFIWCDQTTALHPLAAPSVTGELETYPAGL